MRYTPEYRAWTGMRYRCRTQTSEEWSCYGGRGIIVCERWDRFENFFSDMGGRPSPKHSIERINNDGNYEPGNCKWATCVEQNRNNRNNRIIRFKNQTMTLGEWANILGIGATTLSNRLSLWNKERALTEAPHEDKRHNQTGTKNT